MPFRLFLQLSAAAQHLGAEHELRGVRASAYGAAIGFGGAKDPQLKKYTRRLERVAFPTED